MYRNALFISIFTLLPAFLTAQNFFVNRIDPPSWMPKPSGDTLELLIRGSELSDVDEVTSDNQNCTILGFEHPENANYLYVSVFVNEVESEQNLSLQFNGGRQSISANWKINPWQERKHGLTASDYLYLITPDRFANANPSNDVFLTMNEDSIAREEPYARHGGDIEGITERLDYIQNLGITGLWVGPLLENNEFKASYHGYAITDHYLIDPRFGTHEEYLDLVDQLHERDMKMVMDVVYNHFGDQHYLFLDPPSADWFNQWEEYTQTNYRATALMDPYASETERKRMSDGWFDKHMPDVNQRNPHVAKWLIQNSMWWIDNFGIDAFRIDTYAYPDQRFMADLDRELLERYPDFFIFAETWVHHEPTQFWFMQENENREFNSHLQSVTDFQFYFALKEALTSSTGWANGLAKVYYVLAHDYMYEDPYRLVTFVDNHDEGRFYGMIGQDMRKYKMGLGLMLTTRGIPCTYYGTEILLRETDGHGKMRQDFPGGWAEDTVNKFEYDNLTEEEKEAFDFAYNIGNLRSSSPALTTGRLMQWAVTDGVYAYARTDGQRTFLILISASDKDQSVELSVYAEMIGDNRQFLVHGSTDLPTGDIVHFESSLNLAPNTIHILEVSTVPFE
ncbi:alpha-amylase family glycosyl hydrolase [Phaeocystidibacter luteus]|uniref:Alpha-amylase n=1 Tax=Phaeocystidibacter luteus TaxID=911197 RepID=A0A6N6RL71_9FLAO|nr:alpha-amylase family glycosyl hydrolase [Phaeocystidibacter luteus]KAB2813841.1 alpha-amylase [Phaeocystidibacter luteus]